MIPHLFITKFKRLKMTGGTDKPEVGKEQPTEI